MRNNKNPLFTTDEQRAVNKVSVKLKKSASGRYMTTAIKAIMEEQQL